MPTRWMRMLAWLSAATTIAITATGTAPIFDRFQSPRGQETELCYLVYETSQVRGVSVLAAGWLDGLVVFDLNENASSLKDLYAGRVTREQMAAVLERLERDGFFNDYKYKGGYAPDQTHASIIARRGERRARYDWHQRVTRSGGAHVGASEDVQAFVRMWQSARTAVAFGLPTEFKRLSDDPDAKARIDRVLRKQDVLP